MSMIKVPVSLGELLDKITILEIKSERIEDPDKLVNIRRELELLGAIWEQSATAQEAVQQAREALKATNEKLWVIEDQIRMQEAAGCFGQQFIQLARDVYRTNDMRARLKKEVNLVLGSELVEEKSYQDY